MDKKERMSKIFCINGGVYATKGSLFAREIHALDGRCPKEAIIITPPDGWLEITEDTGSIFDTFYVKGAVTALGIENERGSITAYKDIYQFTVDSYNKGRGLLEKLLLSPPNDFELRCIFYQQQFAHVFSLLELFLSDTIVRQTCDCEESYHRVLDSNILCSKRIIRDKIGVRIIRGDDCLKKERLYIKSMNNIVYHRFDLVSSLLFIAFGISDDLSDLEGNLKIRNDIIHRFGRGTNRMDNMITETDVIDLLKKVDSHVSTISSQISKISDTKIVE